MGLPNYSSNGDLSVAEVRLLNSKQREMELKETLKVVNADYDFIIIDCPPTLNMLTINALVAAQSIIVPMQCEYYALEGLTSLMGTIDQIRQTANPDLKLEGLLRTMYDGRNRLTTEVSEQLVSHFAEKVYQTAIPRMYVWQKLPAMECQLCITTKHPKALLLIWHLLLSYYAGKILQWMVW